MDERRLARELAKQLWRPREPDEMPGQPCEPHPETLRGQALSIMERVAVVESELGRTRRGLILLRISQAYVAVRRRLRR